ncbi:uncharacterized protein LOC111349831 [Spodoptera litura]|uniref:Uncharacterized protein LOC111349831 n=1 Tax=Spodoptera litura TaxID=69820 RepID=A0A9J7DW39_SPOLT|nr:uncharacterized protein LOC111349831 [Spodoptera litura]
MDNRTTSQIRGWPLLQFKIRNGAAFQPFPLTYTIYVVDDTDCTFFYECALGKIVRVQCPDGHDFDVDEICIPREESSCKEKHNFETTSIATIKPIDRIQTTPATTSETTPASSSETTPATSSETTPATSSETTPATSSETTSATSSETTPATSSETTPATSSGTTPATSSETTAATSSETTPATSSETTPATSSETTPVTSSETTPATSSETTPATSSETTPATTSPAVTNSEITVVTNSETTPVPSSDTTPAVTNSETTPAVTNSETTVVTNSETTAVSSSETTPAITNSETTPAATTSETTSVTNSETTPATSSETTPATSTETTPATSSETTPSVTTLETTPTVTSSETTLTTTSETTPVHSSETTSAVTDSETSPAVTNSEITVVTNSETTPVPNSDTKPAVTNSETTPGVTNSETTVVTNSETTAVSSSETTPAVTNAEITPATSSETTPATTSETTSVTSSETSSATSSEPKPAVITSETTPAVTTSETTPSVSSSETTLTTTSETTVVTSSDITADVTNPKSTPVTNSETTNAVTSSEITPAVTSSETTTAISIETTTVTVSVTTPESRRDEDDETSEETMPTVTPLPPCTTTDAWLRPLEPFCNRFLLCLFGQLISEVCAPGYHFSPTNYQCMPVADAQCEDAFTTTTMAITTTETTPATKSDTTIPITTSESTPVTTSQTTPATSSETTDVTTSKSRRDDDEITSTTSETTPAVTTSETTPATSSEITPSVTTSETTPSTSSETTPATSSETTPATSSEITPSVTTSETTPITTSETTPATSSETIPATSSETTPATSSETTTATSSETTIPITTSESTPATSSETTDVTKSRRDDDEITSTTSETTPAVTTSETTPADTSSETTPATSSETTPPVTTSETTTAGTTSETTPATSSETTPAVTTSETTPADTTSETTPATSTETTPPVTTSETTPAVTSSETTITTTKRSTSLCTNRDLWLKPQYSCCDRFLLCLFGKITSQRCPLDFQFNPVLLLCQPPAEANCNSDTTTITPTTKQDLSPDNRIKPPPTTSIETTVTSPETTPITSSETTAVTSSETTPVTSSETTPVTSPETTSITTSETIPAPLPKCSYRDMWFKPDPHNCEFFYLCVFGEILHEQCPEGTEASTTSFACLPKEQAGCSNSNQTVVTTTPRVHPVPYCSRYDIWIEADAIDCGQYYVCTFGHLTHETCPAEYRFSASEKECLPKSQVNCFEKDQSTPRNWKDAICADYSNLPLVFLEDPKDCRRYYICSLGKSTLLHCPDNFSFSVEKQICLPSYQVLCKSLCPSDSTQFVVDPQSESHYIICYNGTPLPQQCPHKYVFDPKLLGSSTTTGEPTLPDGSTTTEGSTTTGDDTPVSITTQGSTTGEPTLPDGSTTMEGSTTTALPDGSTTTEGSTTTGDDTPVSTTTQGSTTEDDGPCPPDVYGNVPHPDECNAFYLCVSGVAVKLYCASGYEFDATVGNCVAIAPGGCTLGPVTGSTTLSTTDSSTTPIGSTTDSSVTTTEGPEICPIGVWGNVPHPTLCNSFYVCAAGSAIQLFCSEGFEFDPNTGSCVPIAEGGCTMSQTTTLAPTTSTTTPPETTTVDPNCPPGTWGNVPHPELCNSFYLCTGGHAIQLFCSEGFEFDPEHKTCVVIAEGGCTLGSGSTAGPVTTPDGFQSTTTMQTTTDSNEVTGSTTVNGDITTPDGITTLGSTTVNDVTTPDDVTTPGSTTVNYVTTPDGITTPGSTTVNGVTTPDDITTPDPSIGSSDSTPGDSNTTPALPTTTEAVDINPCPADVFGNVPNPESCNSYFLCVNGEAIPFTCADGLEFDPIEKTCVVIAEGGCTLGSATTPEGPSTTENIVSSTTLANVATTSTPALDETICVGVFGTIPHPELCNSFYICDGDKPMQLFCVDGYEYDHGSRGCVEIAEGGCTFQSATTTEATTIADPPICAEGQYGNIPHPELCNSFYMCTGGQAIQLFCSEGFEFDPNVRECVRIAEGGCTLGSQTTPAVDVTTTPSSELPDTTTERDPDDFLPGDVVTTTERGVTSTSEPTTTAAGSTSSDIDDVPTEGSTTIDYETTTLPTTHGTTTEAPICAPGVFGNVPHPDRCDAFYLCSGGNALPFTCGEGLEFDPESKLCVQIAEGGCTMSKATTPGGETTAQDVTPTAAPETTVQDVTTPAAPETTAQDVTTPAAPETTVQDVTTTATPETTTLAPTTASDDIPDDGTTTEALIDTTTEAPICAPGVFGNVPHPDRCDAFYLCSGGNALPFTCGEGLEFDPESKLCVLITEGGCTMSKVTTPGGETTAQDVTTTAAPETTAQDVTTTAAPETTAQDVTTTAAPETTAQDVTTTAAPETTAQDVTTTAAPETTVQDVTTTAAPETTTLAPTTASDDIPDDGTTTEAFIDTTTEAPICAPGVFGNVPHPDRCDAFYLCSGGNALPFTCGEGLEFNPETRLCVQIAEGGCTMSKATTPGGETTAQDVTTTAAPETTEQYVTQAGPELFDTTTVADDTTTDAPICAPGMFGNVPHPDRCDAFYLCSGGNALLFTCSDGLEFDRETRVCMPIVEGRCTLPQRSGQKTEAKIELTTEAWKTTVNFMCPDNEDRFLADPNNCDKFFRCVEGYGIQMHCPNGQEYDASGEKCVAIAKGGCSYNKRQEIIS